MREFKLRLKIPKETLFDAGYSVIKDSYELREPYQGRFHCTCNKNGYLVCHYDVFIDGKHTVFDMPIKLTAERSRIQRIDAKNFNKRKKQIARRA